MLRHQNSATNWFFLTKNSWNKRLKGSLKDWKPFHSCLTLFLTEVVTWYTMRGLIPPSPGRNRVKTKEPTYFHETTWQPLNSKTWPIQFPIWKISFITSIKEELFHHHIATCFICFLCTYVCLYEVCFNFRKHAGLTHWIKILSVSKTIELISLYFSLLNSLRRHFV